MELSICLFKDLTVLGRGRYLNKRLVFDLNLSEKLCRKKDWFSIIFLGRFRDTPFCDVYLLLSSFNVVFHQSIRAAIVKDLLEEVFGWETIQDGIHEVKVFWDRVRLEKLFQILFGEILFLSQILLAS